MDLKEQFVTEFSITSVVVGESSSKICLEGKADKYGPAFLTYVLDSAGDRTSGTYSGSARAFPDGEEMVSAVFRGIWRREGGKVKIFSLDNLSNGDQNLAVIELDVIGRQAVATVYSLI